MFSLRVARVHLVNDSSRLLQVSFLLIDVLHSRLRVEPADDFADRVLLNVVNTFVARVERRGRRSRLLLR